jgi:KipI family sensor histidine kinase inhibitor
LLLQGSFERVNFSPNQTAASGAIRVIRAGERAFLVECERQEQVFVLSHELQGRVADVIPGDRVLTVIEDVDGSPLADTLRGVLEAAGPLPGPAEQGAGGQIVIPVHYDGEDLPVVAELAGMTVAEVVAAHTGSPWRAHFLGFSPGFAYLTNPHARLTVPRRDSPRSRVPAGSVALASGYSAVYPTASPGGWQLIGRTDLSLWDARRERPALITAGAQVRFEALP